MDPAEQSQASTRVEAREHTERHDDTQDGAPRSAAEGPARGSALGRYLVVDRLGAGGMGVVYRAFDPDLDRSVALKLVAVGARGGSEGEVERARLLREAQAMARLSHPNVIPVFDVGILDEAVFVAMELVDGLTLKHWLAERPRRPEEILAAFIDAGRGLEAAHAADVIHRDFKPDNVMVGRDGRVRVLDFGLARAAGGEASIRHHPDLADLRSSIPASLERSMTAEGTVMGTPAYMSPEQHVGAAVGAASDQFSFCVALFEALYGARPFAGETMAKLTWNVLQGLVTMPPGAKARAPAWVLAALQRGLSVAPEQRFESMEALLDALGHDPARRRRRVALGVGAVGVLGLGAGLGLWLAPTPPAAVEAESTLCTGAPAHMQPVWSPARREAIGQAFAASGLGFATQTWEATAAVLDAKAEAWVAEHTAACRATRVTGEQSLELMDLRMACLERQREGLDALLHALAEPGPDGVGQAFDAARRLPDPARCGDLEALRAPIRPPDDPDAIAELQALRPALAAVWAELALGHVTAAKQQLTPLLPRVDALDHPPLLAEAHGLHAELLEQTGEVEPGRRARERAHAAAVAAGDARQAADQARALVFTVGYRLADARAGQPWLELGRAWLRRLDGRRGDDELAARLASAEGAMLVAAGRYDEALAAHALARAHWQAQAPDGPDLATVLDDIGAVHVARGQPEAAVRLHRESLRLKRLAYGDRHPQVAASARELGNALGHAGRGDEALVQLREALAIERESRGERTQYVAALLDDIGRGLRGQGDLDGAIEHHRQALEIWQAVLGDPHPDLAVSVLNVGYTLSAAGRFEDALAELSRALAMFDATVGPEHPYIIYASNAVASALVDLGRHDEAKPHLERALAMTGVQVDPTLYAETKFTLAHALWGTGQASAADRARARRLATEALASYRTQAERWGPQIEQIEAWLAAHG